MSRVLKLLGIKKAPVEPIKLPKEPGILIINITESEYKSKPNRLIEPLITMMQVEGLVNESSPTLHIDNWKGYTSAAQFFYKDGEDLEALKNGTLFISNLYIKDGFADNAYSDSVYLSKLIVADMLNKGNMVFILANTEYDSEIDFYMKQFPPARLRNISYKEMMDYYVYLDDRKK